jgi:hypothetical protein
LIAFFYVVARFLFAISWHVLQIQGGFSKPVYVYGFTESVTNQELEEYTSKIRKSQCTADVQSKKS